MTEATQERVDASTLEGLTDKRVSLTFVREGETVTLEGRVEMGAAIGVMFKEKGKSNVQLIEAGNIIAASPLAVREPKVTVKTLQPVADGRVRQHLADRHGATLEQVNGMTEAAAKELHDGIDHSGLAHKHEVPQAAAEAGATGNEPIADVSDVEGAEPEAEYEDDDTFVA